MFQRCSWVGGMLAGPGRRGRVGCGWMVQRCSWGGWGLPGLAGGWGLAGVGGRWGWPARAAGWRLPAARAAVVIRTAAVIRAAVVIRRIGQRLVQFVVGQAGGVERLAAAPVRQRQPGRDPDVLRRDREPPGP